ncbi:MAG: hypothetical protein AAF067_07200 [Pseudomonadota bacterium]
MTFTLLLLAQAATLPPEEVISVFETTCVEGKRSFSNGEAQIVGFQKLPATARSQLNLSWRPQYHQNQGKNFKRIYAQYHRLSGYPGRNYLAVEERKTSSGAHRRVCALITSSANIMDAVSFLDPDLSTVSSKQSDELFLNVKSENWFQITGEGKFLSVHRLSSKYIMIQAVAIENEARQLSQAEKLAREQHNRRHNLWLGIFKAACTEGEAKLDPKLVNSVEWEALPRPYRNWYKSVREQSSFYHIQTSPPGYLIFFENSEAKGYDYLRGCAVAAKDLDLDYANAVIRGSEDPNSRSTDLEGQMFKAAGFQHRSPDFDYVIDGSTVLGSYKVVQLSFVGEKRRKELIEQREMKLAEMDRSKKARQNSK